MTLLQHLRAGWSNNALKWALPATAQERAAALWSFGYFFMLLASYYVLRPLRDQMGIAGGVRALPWLFTATFVTLLIAQPIYGALVAKLTRARFIPIVYHFFVANLAVFWFLLSAGIAPVTVARVFFVWVSVFNLFAIAVFWSFMADLFSSEQGKRLFGFIGAGGTAGGLLGPIITIGLSVPIGPTNLLIVAIVFLELAIFCVYRLEGAAQARRPPGADEQRLGGSAFAALTELMHSPYLVGVAAWVSLLSFGATILYFEQANIVAATVQGAGAQTRIFASIDLAVGLLTLATQVLVTAHLLKRFGRCLAGGLRSGLRGACACAGPCRRHGISGGAALDELRDREPCAPSVLHRGRPRGKIQGEEPDRCGGLSRLRRALWVGVRQPARAGARVRPDRAHLAPRRGGVACAVVCIGTDAGAPGRGAGCDDTAGEQRMIGTTRRTFGAMLAAGLLARPASGQRTDAQLITRAIPSSGERLPAVGLGTAYVFDSDNEQTQRAAAGVLATLVETGGRLVDSGSTYGSAEIVLGNAIASAGLRDKIFIATKLEAPDAAELKRSLTRLKMTKLDLLQFHNVSNPRQSLAQFKDWKTQGICRYIGITSTFHRDFAAIEAVLRREKPEFVQIDYSVDNREVEKRILPLAADVKAAVLTAQPFGSGRLFRTVRGQSLPDWAKDFAGSWAQFFLKYLLADQRVTAVIPGTSNPAHMADNLGAMRGRLPDPEERKRMVALVESL